MTIGVVLALVGLLVLIGSSMPTATDHVAEQRYAALAMAVRQRAQSQAYFQRQLIENAATSERFGGDLALLGLDWRALQGQPITEAYDAAHAQALRVEDPAMRRQFLLELFDETEP